MTDLPAGWNTATLGDVGRYLNGRSFKEAEWRRTGLPIIRIQNLNNLAAPFNYTEAEYEPRYRAQKDDLLVAWAASLGAHIWKGGDAWVNQHIFKVDPKTEVVSKQYLYYAIKQSLDELKGKTHGSGIVHVTKRTFESQSIPLPPLAEQTRIASKLDTLVEKINACRGRLDRVPQILKKFREAVLEAAVSGKLTEDRRVEQKESSQWRTMSVEDVSTKVTDGEHITPKRAPQGHYLLSARNVRNGFISLQDVDRVSDEEYLRIRKRCDPSLGDVLLSCSGSVGRVALVDRDDGYVMVRSAAMIRPSRALIHPKYLMYGLQSPDLQAQILAKSSATAQSNIFLGAIKSLKLPVPSIPEQAEIVRRIDAHFALANSLERRYEEATKRVAKLTPSVLAKAFRGELVPQDPNDESADSLLQRTRANPVEFASQRTKPSPSAGSKRRLRRVRS